MISCVKSGGRLLDIGCYCGTDLRQLARDGCPQENLLGTDFVDHWDLGYKLYKDADKFNIKYIEADILHPSKDLMESCSNNIDIVSAIHLLHNWDWPTQLAAVINIISFTRSDTKVVGVQVGTRSHDSSTWISETFKPGFQPHSVESFARMWDVAGKATGTEWKSVAEMRDWETFGYGKDETRYIGDDAGMLQFVVTRVR